MTDKPQGGAGGTVVIGNIKLPENIEVSGSSGFPQPTTKDNSVCPRDKRCKPLENYAVTKCKHGNTLMNKEFLKKENKGWGEKMMDEFCVMFERATIVYEDRNEWPEKLEAFIHTLLANRDKEKAEKWQVHQIHEKCGTTLDGKNLYWAKVSERQPKTI